MLCEAWLLIKLCKPSANMWTPTKFRKYLAYQCLENLTMYKWAATWDFQQCGMCDQQILRLACAYAQSDQILGYSMSVLLLIEHNFEFLSLKGGCTGSSESTLVKMPHCWKSRVAAQICKMWSKSNMRFKSDEHLDQLKLSLDNSCLPFAHTCGSKVMMIFTYCLRMDRRAHIHLRVM